MTMWYQYSPQGLYYKTYFAVAQIVILLCNQSFPGKNLGIKKWNVWFLIERICYYPHGLTKPRNQISKLECISLFLLLYQASVNDWRILLNAGDWSGIARQRHLNIALKTSWKCGCLKPYRNGLMQEFKVTKGAAYNCPFSSGSTRQTAYGVRHTMKARTT